MEIIITIILVLVLAETSFLLFRSIREMPLGSRQKRKIYVDTSAVMDPRLIPVAESGFIGDDILIPRSVTNELQLLADGKDSEKRSRARAGLEAVRQLERVVYFDASIVDDELDHTPVDQRLMDLAKKNHGLILTNDYNLQKVAETEQIDVLSLNALALALRGEFLPGETARVKVVSQGNNPKQGVGYLRDGTMVVIDSASSKVGQEVEVEFVRLNQTASGTMMFARLAQEKSAGKAISKTANKSKLAKNARQKRTSKTK